jgi:hypothetical protein
MMKKLTIFLVLSFLAPHAIAEETVRSISWEEVKAEGRLTGGEVMRSGEDREGIILKIDHSGQTHQRTELLNIENPGITRPVYALMGEVAYEDVKGKGYIEMMNHFPGGKSFFSRTLAPSGPMAVLKGTSGWRQFMLPFFTNRGDPGFVRQSLRPERLMISVVLPEGGIVYLSSLRLIQFQENENPFALFSKHAGHWWSERTGGLIGGICGTIIGCLGGLIGLLAGKGKAKNFVLGLMKFLIFFGAIGTALGVIALIRSQPYSVYYPLLLAGGITALLFGALLGNVRKRYEERELRKMHAADFR